MLAQYVGNPFATILYFIGGSYLIVSIILLDPRREEKFLILDKLVNYAEVFGKIFMREKDT